MAPEPILLTPGPLTTQLRTRQAMLRDWGSRDPGFIALTAELDADFAAEKLEVFRQAWSLLRDLFYDEAMHGADWPRERARHEPYVRAASVHPGG